MSDTFSYMIQELAGVLKIDHFTMDSATQCTLNIDGFIVLLQCIPDAEQVLMACALRSVPDVGKLGERETLYRLLLQGQFLFKETAGATLAVDPENSFVSLQLVRNMTELGNDSLFPVLETFINVASFWRTKLETEIESHEDDAANVTEALAFYIKV